MNKIVSLLVIGLLCFSMLSTISPKVEAQIADDAILYAGGSDPGVVYRYGGADWEVISSELGYAVLCLVEYDGHLYAGTTSAYGGGSGIGRIYRYDGGTTWTLVGDNMDHDVCSLAVYQGDLYAGTSWNGMKLYRYEGGTTWTQVIDSIIWSGTRTLSVSHDYLLMGDVGYDRFGRWDGSNFYADLDGGGSCIYDYEDYGGYVYAAAYVGRMWRSTNAIHWSVVLDYYDGNMWELEEFQGKLYMSYNNGELRAYDGTGSLRGTLVYTAPDGIISMTANGEYLYFGTGGDAVGYGPESSGIATVYRYDGSSVERISDEDEMQTGVQVLCVSSLGPRRFDPLIDGFSFFNYDRQPDCVTQYTMQEIYDMITPIVPENVPAYLVLIAAQLLWGWRVHEAHCFGMSKTAIEYYYNQNEIPIGYDTIYDITATDFWTGAVPDVRAKIENYQHEQIWTDPEAIFNMLLHYVLNGIGGVLYPHASFEKEILSITAMSNEFRPALLGLYGTYEDSWMPAGHAIVAYEFELAGDEYLIKSYDSNMPGLTHTFRFARDVLGRLYIDNDGDPYFAWGDLICLNAPLGEWTWDFIVENTAQLIKWIEDHLEELWDELMALKEQAADLWNDFVSWVKDNAIDLWDSLVEFELHCPANLHIYDSEGMHVGLTSSGDLDLGFDALYLLSNELEYCALPNAESGTYIIELVGTGQGSYNLDIELIVGGTTLSSKIVSGETTEGAVYTYILDIGEDAVTIESDPATDLGHLNEFINGLPDDSFRKPELASQRKNALINKIDEVVLKVQTGNYTDAINKLFYDIRAKMDGDSTAKDWIIAPETQIRLCIIIDHIISTIEMHA